MDSFYHPSVESVERLEDGVVISFEDGRSALYPASLLYAMLTLVQEIPSEDPAHGDPEPEQ